ncbi:PREDICTED: basic 7S globulin [Prunus dulcis]|uniref:PREDICTED: basic 7S globulin n=2 Tax=Prunus dulcis TaxID=3755 RepID=A0A5E4EEW0_PRUDU|nr:PREDICTED: basic 7S globulin [Prunus dulcis]
MPTSTTINRPFPQLNHPTITMASSTQYCLFFSISTLLLFFNASPVLAQQSFRPKALVIPVSKDASTLQYTTHITQRTPLVPINLVLDLGGQFLWVDCEQNYVSSTYSPARCRSAQCSLARASGCGDCFSSSKPGCNNNTCGLTPDNTVTGTATGGELAYDVVSVPSTNGFNPGRNVSVSQFLFTCAPTFLLEGLAAGVSGMAGLGRTRISLPSQFASAFSFDRKFAICLSSSVSSNGVVFFGDGPYVMLPNVDVSESLIYTPLFINPVSTASAFSQGEASSEYFIKVNSIKVNEKPVAVNTTLLSIDRDGVGGTKISTVNPYTVLEASIFKAVTEAFISESKSMNITRVSSVGPFEVCFSRDNVLSTRVGPAVPSIDLVLQNESTFWRVFGANSMVQVNDDVLCLAVVNGGESPRTSIVIGGYQLENNLLQFDLATSRLGFSSSLLFRQTTCSNFNFTSTN